MTKITHICATQWLNVGAFEAVYESQNFGERQWTLYYSPSNDGWAISDLDPETVFFPTKEQAVRRLETIHWFELGPMIDIEG